MLENNKFKGAKSLLIRAIELNPGSRSVSIPLYGYLIYQLDGD